MITAPSGSFPAAPRAEATAGGTAGHAGAAAPPAAAAPRAAGPAVPSRTPTATATRAATGSPASTATPTAAAPHRATGTPASAVTSAAAAAAEGHERTGRTESTEQADRNKRTKRTRGAVPNERTLESEQAEQSGQAKPARGAVPNEPAQETEPAQESEQAGPLAPVPTGRVVFVGAGPGAADLLTFRAARAIAEADIVIWAASLVQADVLDHARHGAEILDSSKLSMEDVLVVYERAARERLAVSRIHSGDPALWGAVQEQLDRCRELGLDTEIVPGVSSFSAVAAIAQRELTIPEIAQSVILTRLGGGKTPMPPGEEVRAFARHGTTMAVFLSAARSGQLAGELQEGGYPEDTPVVVAHQATWPEELVVRCTVGTLEETVKRHRLWKHTLFLVGPALGACGTRSHLYHPGHFHGFRRADPAARRALRATDRAPGDTPGDVSPPPSPARSVSEAPAPSPDARPASAPGTAPLPPAASPEPPPSAPPSARSRPVSEGARS